MIEEHRELEISRRCIDSRTGGEAEARRKWAGGEGKRTEPNRTYGADTQRREYCRYAQLSDTDY